MTPGEQTESTLPLPTIVQIEQELSRLQRCRTLLCDVRRAIRRKRKFDAAAAEIAEAFATRSTTGGAR